MSVTAYGYTLNCQMYQLPFEESIRSMLEIVDEVVIVDGGSTDGTYEILQTVESLRLYRQVYDYDEPTGDVRMKMAAAGRSKGDYLWVLDVDEVIHEKDYSAWRTFLSQLGEVDLFVLPMIDFWSDRFQLRYKIQGVYRNNGCIRQGVIQSERRINPVTGRLCAIASHGAEFIDSVTYEYLTPKLSQKWIPSQEFLLRYEQGPCDDEYMKQVHEYIASFPVVYHYSWYSMIRKFLQRNFFQNHQDQLLFGRINFWKDRWSYYGGIPAFEGIWGNMEAQYNQVIPVTILSQVSHPAIMKKWRLAMDRRTKIEWKFRYDLM